MKVLVKWNNHDRVYSIGIQRLFRVLNIDVNDAQIETAIKQLLEQEEMEREYSEHQ